MNVTSEIRADTFRSLLCSAFEGGSNHWYMIVDHEFPEGVTYADFRKGGRFTLNEYWHPEQLIPLHPGCATLITTEAAGDEGDAKRYRLDREAMARGMQVMADRYPAHYADVLTENDDADTADVFLQCCLFGEIVYG